MDASPRLSFLYVVHCKGRYKIGFARSLYSRMATFQTDNPFLVTVVMFMQAHEDHVRRFEKEMHADLREYRVRGEWFMAPRSAVNLAARSITERFQSEGAGCWERGGGDFCAEGGRKRNLMTMARHRQAIAAMAGRASGEARRLRKQGREVKPKTADPAILRKLERRPVKPKQS